MANKTYVNKFTELAIVDDCFTLMGAKQLNSLSNLIQKRINLVKWQKLFTETFIPQHCVVFENKLCNYEQSAHHLITKPNENRLLIVFAEQLAPKVLQKSTVTWSQWQNIRRHKLLWFSQFSLNCKSLNSCESWRCQSAIYVYKNATANVLL